MFLNSAGVYPVLDNGEEMTVALLRTPAACAAGVFITTLNITLFYEPSMARRNWINISRRINRSHLECVAAYAQWEIRGVAVRYR